MKTVRFMFPFQPEILHTRYYSFVPFELGRNAETHQGPVLVVPGLYFSALRRTARHIKRGRRIYGIGQQRSRNGAHGIMRAPYARRARFRQWHGHGSGRRSPTCCARVSRRTACVSSRSTDASESCASRACACARPPRDGVGTSGGRGTESTRVVGRCPSARKYYRPLPLWPL